MVKTIRKDDANITIIMITAHSEEERLLQTVNLELAAYLIKPIDNERTGRNFELRLDSLTVIQ